LVRADFEWGSEFEFEFEFEHEYEWEWEWEWEKTGATESTKITLDFR
jgi:hypothetical protein